MRYFLMCKECQAEDSIEWRQKTLSTSDLSVNARGKIIVTQHFPETSTEIIVCTQCDGIFKAEELEDMIERREGGGDSELQDPETWDWESGETHPGRK